MHFENTNAFHLFWLLPLAAFLLHLAYLGRQKAVASFLQLKLIKKDILDNYRRQYRIKAALLMIFLFVSVVALARPQWGIQWQEITRKGLDILIAVDVSKSMLTQDVKPNRLWRTKLAIKDMLKKLKGDRVGLIAFAGQSFLVCPLTSDYNGFVLSLDDLNEQTIPRGGTNLTSAIQEAIKSYGKDKKGDRILVLVTDGEDNEGDAIAAAKKAQAQGIKIYTVGIGTQEGELIQVTGADGQKSFLKSADGNFVKSRLNEHLLQQIAYITQGTYVRSSGADFGLDYLYDQQFAQKEKYDLEQRKEKKYVDRFEWFVAIALLIIIFEGLVPTWQRQ